MAFLQQQDFPVDVVDEPGFELVSIPESGTILIGFDRSPTSPLVQPSEHNYPESVQEKGHCEQHRLPESSFLDLYPESPILIIITDTEVKDENHQHALLELSEMTLQKSWPDMSLYCRMDNPPTDASLSNALPPCDPGYLHVPTKLCTGRIDLTKCICSTCSLRMLKKNVQLIQSQREESNGTSNSGTFSPQATVHSHTLTKVHDPIIEEQGTMIDHGDYLEAIPEEDEEDEEEIYFFMAGNHNKAELYDTLHQQAYDFVGAMCYTSDDDSDDESEKESDKAPNAPLRWSDEEIVDPERPRR